jgi:hypothetical protein
MRDAQCRKPKWSGTRHKSLESPVRRKAHAGFGGRLHGKGPHPHGIRDLAVQPTLPGVTTGQGGREGRPQGEGAQVTGHYQDRRYAKLQDAETVLGVLRERGRRVWVPRIVSRSLISAFTGWAT